MVYHHKNLCDTCNFDNFRKAGYTSDRFSCTVITSPKRKPMNSLARVTAVQISCGRRDEGWLAQNLNVITIRLLMAISIMMMNVFWHFCLLDTQTKRLKREIEGQRYRTQEKAFSDCSCLYSYFMTQQTVWQRQVRDVLIVPDSFGTIHMWAILSLIILFYFLLAPV